MQKHSAKASSKNLKKIKDFEAHFLLLFTKELIRNTSTYKNLFIKQEVKSFVQHKQHPEPQTHLPRKIVLQPVGRRMVPVNPLQNRLTNPTNQKPKRTNPNQSKKSSVSESGLPATFDYLKPTATSEEIDLKKLNPLVKDPLVQIIECNGPNEKVVVMGGMGRKTTGVVLTKEDIDQIIKLFSEASKIPVSEGVFKVVHGKLILSAIISEVVDSKFVIKKMTPGPSMRV